MEYLLDTNICIYIIKRRPPPVLERFRSRNLGEIGISSITVAELSYGVQKSQRVAQNQVALEQFLLPLALLEFDEAAAWTYGKIRAELERQGNPIRSLDLLIAAQALNRGITLVTNNRGEFERVDGLAMENWAS
ncbi:MAG: type II toxin-antitoxin system VapC family toxin [Synechococcales cyanobacterium CRU_2_2]|nr:type II toxin-antitoxin system VapC family toxin [Synechococcales cyanobacterium CRU_2_2]